VNERPHLFIGLPIEASEHDCAYPDGGYATASPAPQHQGLWQIAPELYRAALPDNHELAVSAHADGGVVVLNPAAKRVLDSFATPCSLHEAPAIAERMALRGLLAPVGAQPLLAQGQPKTLTAWLHVTDACNLSCVYCYLDKSGEAMDEATGLRAIDAVVRSALRHSFSTIKLKYAGGEATLNFGLVRKLHAYAVESAAAAGLTLRETVLSNGVALTRAMITFLAEAGISLMISLDGIGEAHDAQRAFPNGRGSFTHVRRAIERASAGGLAPNLSITVSGRNIAQLPAAVAFALDHDLRFNLNFYRESELTATHTDLAAHDDQMIAGLREALAVIVERLPRRRLLDGLIDRSAFDQPHDHACGAGLSYLVIDQRGGVSACQMELSQPATTVAAADPLGIIKLTPTSFRNVPAREREGCATCVWRPWCAGGCPMLTQRVTGRSDLRSPFCAVYTAIYPEAVRLEGLRLMRWASPLPDTCELLERFA